MKKIFKNKSFTHFLNLEDDILLNKKNFTYWINARKILKKYNLIPGFIRTEINKVNNDLYAVDFVKKNKKSILPKIKINKDISFINHELKKVNKNLINPKNVVDTLEIARGKFPGTSNSLDNLCKRFNIDNSKRKKHNALLDCELLREVYINLIDQKEPTLSLNETEIKRENFIKSIGGKNNTKIIIKPIEKEYIDHKNFLKKEIKKNYF